MSKEKLKIVTNTNSISQDYLDWLGNEFEVILLSSDKVYEGTKPDIALFTGGADVNPTYYTENLGKYTGIDKDRDSADKGIYNLARAMGILSIGICRGAQFLTVMSGADLIQHVEGHTEEHYITVNSHIYTGNIEATSTHHQMMNPFHLNKEEYDLIAWSKYFRSTTYLDGNNNEKDLHSDFLEPEIVYYNKTKSLAIQGHPEFSSAKQKFKDVTLGLIKDKLKK